MSQARHGRSDKALRPGSAQPTTKARGFQQPLSPQSLLAGSTLDVTVEPSFIPYTQVPPACYTPISQSSFPASTSFSDSKEDSKQSNRVKSPSYRDELQSHSVYIDSYGMSIPAPIHSFAQKIIEKERTSPGLKDEEILFIRKQLSALDNADEEITRTGFNRTSLFPTQADYDNAVATGANIPFDQKALPRVLGFNFPPIVTPKPDLHYGYPRNSFNTPEYGVMRHNRLDSYAHPNSANYWPFFAVEFKSSSRGGTHWVAENQNAATGSHCVNSIETLLNYTRGKEGREMTDSVAFSCVADANFASLWVHWQDSGNITRFMSSEMASYCFKRPNDLRAFRSSVRNIIDHGIDERLVMVKDALCNILPQVLLWDQVDRAAKVRRRSCQTNYGDVDVAGSQGSRRG
ncbi:MAG: hypothetical protein Q9187_001814 [Circinaria calcarea]